MKLAVFEGYNDLQFFRSFITKQIGGNVVTSEYRNIIGNFRNLLVKNPEMVKVEILSMNNELLILLSVGSKNNFRIIAEGVKPLIDALQKDGENISSILFVADKDAEDEIASSEEIIKEKFSEDWRIDFRYLLYNEYLEDLILKIVSNIELSDKSFLEDLLDKIEKHYCEDRYLRKRKVGIVHAIVGPRCFGHLFDEIFSKHLPSIDELHEFIDWIKS